MTSRKAFATLSFAAALLAGAPAHAQVFRAYLASTGSDGPACSLSAPCRLLPAALNAVADGGEIWMLDSANYNVAPVAITRSVTILAIPGAIGSVVATAGNAIDIATAGVKVTLRNLVIVPLPGAGGASGVSMSGGAMLTVENCLVANLPVHGILVQDGTVLRITDSVIRDNNNDGVVLLNGVRATFTRSILSGNGGSGISVLGQAAGLTTTADVADSTLDSNFYGLYAASSNATSAVSVSVRDSRAVRNGYNGLMALSSAGATVTLAASNNMVASNANAGILSFNPGARVWTSGNTVSDNDYGLFAVSGSLFESAGNNAVRNNLTNNSVGTITPVALK